MRINISKEIYNELINRCKKTKVEISGTMTANIDDENIIIEQIYTDINCIKSSNKKEIIYDPDKYIEKTIDEMISQQVHIRFHTHPGYINNMACLSYTDKRHTKGRKKIAEFVSEFYKKAPIMIIDCVINRKEMAFYILDEESRDIIRLPLFVDGKEIIPSHELNGIKYYYSTSLSENINKTKERKKVKI